MIGCAHQVISVPMIGTGVTQILHINLGTLLRGYACAGISCPTDQAVLFAVAPRIYGMIFAAQTWR